MNSAIPIATGVARISAMNDDSSVPNASWRMPNLGCAASGLHSSEVMKFALSSFRAGMAFAMRNTAMAAMQYSYLPSTVAFLADRDTPTTAGRVLFDTVHAAWAKLPRS